jgi:hypothetical protein
LAINQRHMQYIERAPTLQQRGVCIASPHPHTYKTIGWHTGREGYNAGQWVGAGTIDVDGVVFDTSNNGIDTHRGRQHAAQRGRSTPIAGLKHVNVIKCHLQYLTVPQKRRD